MRTQTFCWLSAEPLTEAMAIFFHLGVSEPFFVKLSIVGHKTKPWQE